mgnify:CR=1 FL=1
MITLFVIGTFILAVKLFFFAIKMAWGLTKIVAFVVFLPVILIGMLLAGLLSAAFPLLIAALVVAFIVSGQRRV